MSSPLAENQKCRILVIGSWGDPHGNLNYGGNYHRRCNHEVSLVAASPRSNEISVAGALMPFTRRPHHDVGGDQRKTAPVDDGLTASSCSHYYILSV